MHEKGVWSTQISPILLKTKENKGILEKKRLNICEYE